MNEERAFSSLINQSSASRALTFAKVPVVRIGVERWWANALSGLDAFLVGFALVVTRATLLSR